MKKLFLLSLTIFAALMLCAEPPKYVFLFIGDGTSTPQRMVADEYSRAKGEGHLAINTLPVHATTRTGSANSVVTDSAAAATAIACGIKTDNGKLGVDPQNRRVESVAEFAKKNGYRIGIVTTVTINHATPGGFYAHRPNRRQYYEIGLDLVDSGFDYFGGGGLANAAGNRNSSSYRGNLYELAKSNGYTVVSGRKGLESLRPGCGKVIAYGCSNRLPYELDSDGSIPNLAEFTKKGIELLDNPNGFFMMVEGGSIDVCAHRNEAAGCMAEVFGFDRAVRVALDFAAKHPGEVLIIVTGDHETGGMTLGFSGTGYNFYMERLGNQTCTTEEFVRRVRAVRSRKPNLNFEDVKPMLEQAYGFKFTGSGPMAINSKELQMLREAVVGPKGKERISASKLGTAARIIMSNKAGVGWTTRSHTALPVLTTSYGNGAEKFSGFIENTDIAKKLKELLQR